MAYVRGAEKKTKETARMASAPVESIQAKALKTYSMKEDGDKVFVEIK